MDMEEEQQQQQQQPLHRGVIDGIARLDDPNHREERHTLIVYGYNEQPIDRQSLERLVSFLDDTDSHEVITELELVDIRLNEPSDGGLQVLQSFFSRSDTSLTTVILREECNFGSQEDASMLLTAFERNRTVLDLTIQQIENLEGFALGACLSSLVHNMPQLQRLDCTYSNLRVEGVRAFQPALQVNRQLKELDISVCDIRDEGIGLIADALVGNTTIEVLNIGHNDITADGLDDITRILESTQLKTIEICGNRGVFDKEASTQRFALILLRHEFLKDLRLSYCQLTDGGIRIIVDGLVGNAIMEVLNIEQNHITSNGLADITRLLESTQLRKIDFGGYTSGVFNDTDSTQHFVSTLQHKKSSVQQLPGVHPRDFPEDSRAETYASIKNSLTRNLQLNRVNLLLAPQQQQRQQRNSGTMMFKTWHKAIVKFAKVPNNTGASAIFKLFQARPQLLEKRLKRPAAAAAATSAAVSQDQKRRRLL